MTPAIIFVVALALRLVWVLLPDQAGFYDPIYDNTLADYPRNRTDDASFYLLTGRSLAEGDGYVEPFTDGATARAPPGWSAVLAIFYYAFGPTVLPALVLNAVAGAATAVVVYLLGLQIFGRGTATAAGLAMAFFPGHILYSSVPTPMVFFTFLLALTLLLFCHASKDWHVCALGLTVGAAAMMRPEAVALPAAFLVVWILQLGSLRKAVRRTALVGLAMLLMLLPWAVRSSVQLGSPVLLTTRGGIILMIGHGDGASGGFDFERFQSLWEEYEHLPEPDRQVEMDAAALDRAWSAIRRHPAQSVALVPKKLWETYGHDPIWLFGLILYKPLWVGPVSFEQARMATDVYYYVVIAAAWLVVVVRLPTRRRGGYALLLSIVALWSFLYGFVFFGNLRYHMPLLPILALLAAAGIGGLRARVQDFQRTDPVPFH